MVSFEVFVIPEETLSGLVLKLVIGPDADGEAERVIVPAKLFMLDTVIVLLEFEPCSIETEDGLDATPKSGPGGWTTNCPTM